MRSMDGGPQLPRLHCTARIMLLTALGVCAWGMQRAAAEGLPRYDLDLRFRPEAEQLTGRALIEVPASAISNSTAHFSILLPDGTVMGIRGIRDSSGDLLEYEVSDSTGLLEVPLKAGSTEVDIAYAFPVDSTQLEPYGYYAFAGSSSPWIYPELLQPGGQPYRFANFRVSFEHPTSLAVLTTGGEGERRQAGNRTIARYEAEHVEGFALVAGDGFAVERHAADGAAVVAFYHPDYAERFAKVIEYTKAAAAWYRRTYGFFPLEQLGIIQGHPRWGGGYPLPNMFAIHLGSLSDRALIWITAHELGHYYWGLYVLGEKERLGWLQLALGIWADQLYLAEYYGQSLPEQWRLGSSINRYIEALVANHEQRLGLEREEEKDLGFDYNSLIRHGKAAMGVYLQSLLVGPERFLDLQRQLLRDYPYHPLSEDEFITILERYGATDAAPFFAAWKRGDATIGLAVDSVKPDTVSGGWQISLRRTGLVPYPIEVEAVSATGDTVSHIVAADVTGDTLHVEFPPASVRLDPQGFIPMWNSAHPDIRTAFALALEQARLYEPFIVQAQAVLVDVFEDEYLRYRLVRRLFLLGRWDEAVALGPSPDGGKSPDSCRAAIYSAWAVARMGRRDEAMERLDRWREATEQYGVADFWTDVRAEIVR